MKEGSAFFCGKISVDGSSKQEDRGKVESLLPRLKSAVSQAEKAEKCSRSDEGRDVQLR